MEQDKIEVPRILEGRCPGADLRGTLYDEDLEIFRECQST